MTLTCHSSTVSCQSDLAYLPDQTNAFSFPPGLAARGLALALLGLARLHLALPPPGADPAAKYILQQGHLLDVAANWLQPEISVREQAALLPGGPSESAKIALLKERRRELTEEADRLEGRSPPRPTPPAYLALREDVMQFARGVAELSRVAGLIRSLAEGEEGSEQSRPLIGSSDPEGGRPIDGVQLSLA